MFTLLSRLAFSVSMYFYLVIYLWCFVLKSIMFAEDSFSDYFNFCPDICNFMNSLIVKFIDFSFDSFRWKLVLFAYVLLMIVKMQMYLWLRSPLTVSCSSLNISYFMLDFFSICSYLNLFCIQLAELDLHQHLLPKKAGRGVFKLVGDYYNRKLSGWEPFIENWK